MHTCLVIDRYNSEHYCIYAVPSSCGGTNCLRKGRTVTFIDGTSCCMVKFDNTVRVVWWWLCWMAREVLLEFFYKDRRDREGAEVVENASGICAGAHIVITACTYNGESKADEGGLELRAWCYYKRDWDLDFPPSMRHEQFWHPWRATRVICGRRRIFVQKPCVRCMNTMKVIWNLHRDMSQIENVERETRE